MEEQDVTVTVEIGDRDYDFYIDAEEWAGYEQYEKDEFLYDCEMEARERYCENRTIVTITLPDGTEEEL